MCLCDGRTDILCDETHCDIAGPGEAYNANQCRICWLRLNGAPATNRQPAISPAPIRLGDKVESALSAVGITKERVSEWLGRPCNCKERQEKLNQLSAWAEEALQSTKDKAASLFKRLLGG